MRTKALVTVAATLCAAASALAQPFDAEESGFVAVDLAAWPNGYTRVGTNANSPNANEFALIVQQNTTVATQSTVPYEKAALLVEASTSDPSDSITRDSVGIHSRNAIFAGNSSGRVWATYSEVDVNGDGLAYGEEIAVVNQGSDQPAVNTTTSKYGTHYVAVGLPATAAITLDRIDSSGWHKGLYAAPGVGVAAGGGHFVELDGKFAVRWDGTLLISPNGKLTPVEVGPMNSCGSGKRCLRVAN